MVRAGTRLVVDAAGNSAPRAVSRAQVTPDTRGRMGGQRKRQASSRAGTAAGSSGIERRESGVCHDDTAGGWALGSCGLRAAA